MVRSYGASSPGLRWFLPLAGRDPEKHSTPPGLSRRVVAVIGSVVNYASLRRRLNFCGLFLHPFEEERNFIRGKDFVAAKTAQRHVVGPQFQGTAASDHRFSPPLQLVLKDRAGQHCLRLFSAVIPFLLFGV